MQVALGQLGMLLVRRDLGTDLVQPDAELRLLLFELLLAPVGLLELLFDPFVILLRLEEVSLKPLAIFLEGGFGLRELALLV